VNYLQAAVLGLVQGVTEFLPVSSSAHLRVVPELLGWGDPGASFTAVLQLGTVAAILVAFWSDLVAIGGGFLDAVLFPSRRAEPSWHLGVQLIAGSLPIILIGSLVSAVIDGPLRNLTVVAAALVAGSWWLWSSVGTPGSRRIDQTTMSDAFLIGLAQAAALIPGISRSGSTIGAAVRAGLTFEAAARYSFLLSVPAVVAAGLFGLRDVESIGPIGPLLVAVAVAFVAGFAAIQWLLRLVSRGRFAPFVWYRLGIAVVVLAIAAS
jgi:undecaprenyl-diphosphatase